MKKTAVPTVQTADPLMRAYMDAVKVNLDTITGQLKNSTAVTQVTNTGVTATDLANVITQLNVIIARLNGG